MTLGSGDYEDYIYDHLDRLISVKYNNVVTYTLTYDANGQIAKCVDAKANVTHTYEYDGLGRLIRAWQANSSGDKTLAVENLYDQYGRADKSTYVIGDKTLTYNVSYKADTNLVSSVFMPTSSIASALIYTYDGLDRLTKKDISFATHNDLYEEYSYYGYTSGGVQYTTPLVSSLTLKKDSTATATYSYTYDSLGNILTVSKDGSLIYAYEYDSQNQLTREDDVAQGTSTLFDYDLSGNITARHVFPYWAGCPTSHLRTLIGIDQYCTTVSYGYSAGAWGDMLTSYGGTTISYDTIGNPTNWRNGITNVTWNGRELNSFVKGNYTHSFEYNADGIRTQKTNWYTGTSMAEIYHYVLDGTKIVSEYTTTSSSSTPSNVKYYFYDAAGSIAGFEYNGTTYYFQKNLQGDIIRICNASGNTVVEYTYDAWGKVTSMTGTLASTVGQANPFRYRGYYYDSETGFYLTGTRYYDPQIGRFINADGEMSSVGGDIRGYNLYAYCFNNPVNMSDPTGCWPTWGQIFTAVAIVAVAAVVVVAVVATAGAAGAAIGAAAGVYLGASAATCATIATVATVGAYAVAAGIGACALSNAGEVLTGTNVIRDKVMGGNQAAYDTVQTGLSIAGMGIVDLGTTYQALMPEKTKYPGNDPAKCKVKGYEWRGNGMPGSGQGNFVNSKTGEWLHPDLNHGPPIGPHWDYGIRGNSQTFRIFPDGSMGPK
jgi:RHS repeat-associated protein